MSTNKNLERICIIALVLCIITAAVFMNGKFFGITQAEKVMGYETKLFDNSYVHTIAIEMENWDSFIETAENEEYSVCNVTIDGETIKNVGIRGKGNTSLSNVSSMGSQRYSFKIEFDQYDGTSTYHGLDKLSLNNLIQDSTFMKDYLVYTMMNEFGANAPLCSFVYITVNGEDWGLYLAVEGVEESFLQRNYGNDYGELYKPDSMNFGGGRGNGKGFDMNEFAENFENGEFQMPSSEDSEAGTSPENSSGSSGNPKRPSSGEMPDMGGFGGMVPPGSEIPDMESFGGMVPPDMSGDMQIPEDFSGSFDESQIPEDFSGEMPDMGGPGGMMGGSGMGSDDVKLKYIDDDPESYSNIFDSAKTDITKADKTRLIESLETLSTGKNVEHAVDIEAVLRYFVVHNYAVNGDSYTGSMVHNYYLYEEDGKLSMIPWDYNLAFGTFQSSNASSAVNDSIDSPLSVSGSGDRPMADWIFQNEEYTELYHEYFEKFLETVDVQKIIEDAEAIIAPYIEKDPTKFYTFEEFEKGASTLKEFCKLRTESIESQLLYGEKFTAVDASHLNLSDMGSMNMGKDGNFNKASGGRENRFNNNENTANENASSFKPSSPPDAGSESEPTIDISGSSKDFFDEKVSQNKPEEFSSKGILLSAVSVFVMVGAIIFAKLFKR
ncbi:MAG: spore coat protein CotH [Ruminococcaceae bacterium]|nr:spore coat protein CotH [Oscillospiraceae bacterium]